MLRPVPPDPPRPGRRPTESFVWSRRGLMVYSERFPIKYLLSNHGLCLGVDSHRRSFLFLVSAGGLFLRYRPVGDTVVEDLAYDIPRIVRALRDEDRGQGESTGAPERLALEPRPALGREEAPHDLPVEDG